MLPIALALVLAGASSFTAALTTGQRPEGERLAPATTDALGEAAARVAGLVRSGVLKLREARDGPDGRRDEWFVQVHQGVPIVGGGVWRRTVNGTVSALDGTIYPAPQLTTRPKLSGDQVREAFARLAPGGLGPSLDPELVILPLADRGYVLAYRARVFTGEGLTLHYLDAHTGRRVHEEREPGPPDQGDGRSLASGRRTAMPAILPPSTCDQICPPWASITSLASGNASPMPPTHSAENS